jgi:hypothetical protein
MESIEPDATEIWRLIVKSEQLDDGRWSASIPARDWSEIGNSEREARDRAVERAIRSGEDADAVVRGTPRRTIELEPDDPRVGWIWRFRPQTEQFSDGSWRAWFPSGGWTVTGSSESDAVEKANAEWFRRREETDEIARRMELMRRHLVHPVPGVQNTPSSVLKSALNDSNPAQAVGEIIEGLNRS